MAQDGWGAPRIHAELTKLGFIVSEMTRRHIVHFNATGECQDSCREKDSCCLILIAMIRVLFAFGLRVTVSTGSQFRV